MKMDEKCVFCGRPASEARFMVKGPGEKNLCNDCISVVSIIANQAMLSINPCSACSRIEYRKRNVMIYRPEYDMKVVGQNLKRLRVAKNLSVDDVREYLCLGSVQAIYKYEKGKSYPQADTMFALMELYEANLYDIIKDHEEDEQSSSVHIMEYMMAA